MTVTPRWATVTESASACPWAAAAPILGTDVDGHSRAPGAENGNPVAASHPLAGRAQCWARWNRRVPPSPNSHTEEASMVPPPCVLPGVGWPRRLLRSVLSRRVEPRHQGHTPVRRYRRTLAQGLPLPALVRELGRPEPAPRKNGGSAPPDDRMQPAASNMRSIANIM